MSVKHLVEGWADWQGKGQYQGEEIWTLISSATTSQQKPPALEQIP